MQDLNIFQSAPHSRAAFILFIDLFIYIYTENT